MLVNSTYYPTDNSGQSTYIVNRDAKPRICRATWDLGTSKRHAPNQGRVKWVLYEAWEMMLISCR
jgi:hypothetical protein